MRMQINESDGV